jgi:hypothetical protein
MARTMRAMNIAVFKGTTMARKKFHDKKEKEVFLDL